MFARHGFTHSMSTEVLCRKRTLGFLGGRLSLLVGLRDIAAKLEIVGSLPCSTSTGMQKSVTEESLRMIVSVPRTSSVRTSDAKATGS